MYQIRNGLENELDASIYAYPEYNDGQMEEIKWLRQGKEIDKNEKKL